jgi:hypothetical protein
LCDGTKHNDVQTPNINRNGYIKAPLLLGSDGSLNRLFLNKNEYVGDGCPPATCIGTISKGGSFTNWKLEKKHIPPLDLNHLYGLPDLTHICHITSTVQESCRFNHKTSGSNDNHEGVKSKDLDGFITGGNKQSNHTNTKYKNPGSKLPAAVLPEPPHTNVTYWMYHHEFVKK